MLDDIKYYILLKNIDKFIKLNNHELALEKLNFLIGEGFKLNETFLKRGQLCKKLLMLEEAYSDFTYVITHYSNNLNAYKERLLIDFEMSNYNGALSDANKILEYEPENFEIQRLKFLALVFSAQEIVAVDYLTHLLSNNKYRKLQFLFDETAKCIAEDAFANALKLLNIVDIVDRDNPIKLLNEANIYNLAGDNSKYISILNKIESIFPKYFISRMKFSEMYEERDVMEICFLLELKIFDKQNLFAYPMAILEGYKNYAEGKILDTKECFEKAISINSNKAEAYVLLAQTLQIMSGYNSREYIKEAEENYKKALEIYEREQIQIKADNMRRQIKHLNSSISV